MYDTRSCRMSRSHGMIGVIVGFNPSMVFWTVDGGVRTVAYCFSENERFEQQLISVWSFLVCCR